MNILSAVQYVRFIGRYERGGVYRPRRLSSSTVPALLGAALAIHLVLMR